MPNQTTAKTFQFPDGFRLSIDSGNGFDDLGLVEAGATGTLNWDIERLDAGNYHGILKRAKNHTFQLAPTPLWNFSLRTLNKIMPFTSVVGENLSYAGGTHFELSERDVKMTHFTGFDKHVLVADDITALDTGTVNDYVTIPKTAFTTSLDWTTAIDGRVDIEGKYEVHVSEKDTAGATGQFYTDDTNLYLIVATGIYTDLQDAEAKLAGTIVYAYSDIDWEFVLYNATLDAGMTMNFKGTMAEGVDDFSIGFTAEVDENGDLFNLFKKS